jgi:hypothetical protein
MREILFRGKSYTDNKWHYGYFFYQFSTPVCPERYEITDGAGLGWNCPKETIGQFTGLTDKNGKKIFDNDIIKITFQRSGSSSYLISWDGEGYRWGYDCLSENLPYQGEPVISIERIGNIYDNPELLGAGK